MDVAQTPGITVDGDGRRVLDKEHRGVRIYARLGALIKQRQSGGSRPKSSGSNRKLRAGRIVRPGSQMPRQGTSSSHMISEMCVDSNGPGKSRCPRLEGACL